MPILATLSNAMLALSIAAIVGCVCVATLLMVWLIAAIISDASISRLFRRLYWWLTSAPRKRAS